MRTIYRAEMHPYRYEIKCRPFLKEFMLGVLPHFQVYFYTAGNRDYGKLIQKIIKDIIGSVTKDLESAMTQTFKDHRLISRDDNQRFQSEFEKQKMH